MQCPDPECGAKVEKDALVCPQCGTALKPALPHGPREGGNLAPEILTQASPGRGARKWSNASLILAILSSPVSWIPLAYALMFLLQWALSSAGQPSNAESTYRTFLAYLGTGILVLIMALSAIVTGHIAIAKGKRLSGADRVFWRPLFGALLGYLTVALIILMALSAFNKGRHNNDMAVCQGNLKRIELVLREYANEHQGVFPPLSSQPGVLMFPAAAIPPESFTDRLPFTCPATRHAKHKASEKPASPYGDQSYFYLGYAVLNDDAVEAFAKAYRQQIAAGGAFDEDLVVEDGQGTHTLYRLAEGVEELLRASKDPLSVSPHEGREAYYQVPGVVSADVPLLIERDLGHVDTDWDGPPRGAHVLYLHTGVQFVERGTWPMTEKTQRILAELAE